MTAKMRRAEADVWWSAQQLMRRFQISRMTLNRWIESRGFPKAAKRVAGRRHWLGSQVDAWDAAQQTEVA
jgi:predicted DNA-binding transcriptional regulator AlpA